MRTLLAFCSIRFSARRLIRTKLNEIFFILVGSTCARAVSLLLRSSRTQTHYYYFFGPVSGASVVETPLPWQIMIMVVMRDYYINKIEWNSFVTRTYCSILYFTLVLFLRLPSFFVGDNTFIFPRLCQTHYQIVTLVLGTLQRYTTYELWLRCVADANNDVWNCIREKKTKRVKV